MNEEKDTKKISNLEKCDRYPEDFFNQPIQLTPQNHFIHPESSSGPKNSILSISRDFGLVDHTDKPLVLEYGKYSCVTYMNATWY